MLTALFLALPALALGGDRVLHTYHPRTWYSDLLAGPAEVSPDGRFLLYSLEERLFLVELERGEVGPLAARIGWDSVGWARWAGTGARLLVIGKEKGLDGNACLDLVGGGRTASGLWDGIQDVLGTPLPARRVVAARRNGAPALWLDEGAETEPRKLVDGANRLAWAASPEGTRLALLRRNDAGWADLLLVELESGTCRTLRTDLDTSDQPTRMAWWKDEILASLVGPVHGSPEEKQDPRAARDLDVYAVSAADGALRAVVEGAGDDLVSGVAGGRLFWTNVRTSMRVGLVPGAGGEVREILGETSSLPFWHPDGTRLSAMFGPMSLADWALNWDLGAVRLDADRRPSGPLEPVVVGPHEDFGLTWSPDGRWLAYHSHRSPGPAMGYRSSGATDDLWLRPAAGGAEIRLTRDVGTEVCQPDWSPDGCELVFVALGPRSGRFRAVVVEIDPETGAPLAQRDLVVPGIDGDILAAAYSPTGPEMALEERTRDGRHHLWIVSLETREKRQLAEFEALSEVSGIDFDPSGTSVVYVALVGEHHQLHRVGTDGVSPPERLTDAREELFVPQVSPDGAHVAVTLYTHTKTVLSRSLE